MRMYSNNSHTAAPARTFTHSRRRGGRRPPVFSLCVLAGATIFLACLHAEIKPLWALTTAGFFTILLTLGLMFLWAIISGIERMWE